MFYCKSASLARRFDRFKKDGNFFWVFMNWICSKLNNQWMTMAQIICCIFLEYIVKRFFIFFLDFISNLFKNDKTYRVTESIIWAIILYQVNLAYYTIGIVEAICTWANESRFFVHYCNFTFIAIDFFANWRDFATLKLHLRDYCDFNFHFCFHALF